MMHETGGPDPSTDASKWGIPKDSTKTRTPEEEKTDKLKALLPSSSPIAKQKFTASTKDKMLPASPIGENTEEDEGYVGYAGYEVIDPEPEGEQHSEPQIGQDHITKTKQMLESKGVVFESNKREVIISHKAQNLHGVAPKISEEEFERLVIFVERNKKKLAMLAKKEGKPIYLRREVTELPLSLQVNEDGKVIIHLKSKGKEEPWLFKGHFKTCKESIDYEDPEIKYATATLSSAVMTPEILVELENNKKMNAIPEAVKMVSLLEYRDKSDQKDKFHIVMELCKFGDVNHYQGKITPQEKLMMARNILQFCKHAHDMKLSHQDLKLGNIFITQKKEAKIGDFGLMKPFEDLRKRSTINYFIMPPIYFGNKKARRNPDWGWKSDVYAAFLALALIELNWKEKDLPWAKAVSTLTSCLKENRWITQELKKIEERDQTKYMAELRDYQALIGTRIQTVTQDIQKKMEEFYTGFPDDTPFRSLIKSTIDQKNWDTMPNEKNVLEQLHAVKAAEGKEIKPQPQEDFPSMPPRPKLTLAPSSDDDNPTNNYYDTAYGPEED